MGPEEDIIYKNDNVHPVATNLDILENIFSFLTPPTLKICRLVSKLWERTGSRELGKQTYFSLQNLSYQGFDDNPVLPVVQSYFMRRIKIFLTSSTHHIHQCLGLLSTHSTRIEEILWEGDTYFLPGMKLVLEGIKFPRLRKMSVVEPDLAFSSQDLPEEYVDNPQMAICMEAIKTLEFFVAEADIKDFTTYQQFIDKSVNLERLKIARHFYPDLSKCKKLKALNWVGPTTTKNWTNTTMAEGITFWIVGDFSLSRLFEMLEQVKDSLEDLVLGSSEEEEADTRSVTALYYTFSLGTGCPRLQPEEIDPVSPQTYPVLPKLVKLSVSDLKVFGMTPQSFSRDRLPSLKKLSVRSTKKKEFPINDCLTTWRQEKCLVAAETLELNQCLVGEVPMFSDISRVFPTLKKLMIGVTTPEKEVNNENLPNLLNDTMNEISRVWPNLEELTICIKFNLTLEKLMDGIYAKSFHDKGLNRFKIVVGNDFSITDEGCENFINPFLLFDKLTFEGVQLGKDTRRKMNDFILARKLNVILLD